MVGASPVTRTVPQLQTNSSDISNFGYCNVKCLDVVLIIAPSVARSPTKHYNAFIGNRLLRAPFEINSSNTNSSWHYNLIADASSIAQVQIDTNISG